MFSGNWYQNLGADCSETKTRLFNLFTLSPVGRAGIGPLDNSLIQQETFEQNWNNIPAPFGDKNQAAISIFSDLNDNSGGLLDLKKTATFHVKCVQNNTSVLFEFAGRQMSDADEKSKMLYSVDGGAERILEMSLSKDHSIMGVWRGFRAVPFVRQLLDAKQLPTKISTATGEQLSNDFDIVDFKEAIREVQQTCNW